MITMLLRISLFNYGEDTMSTYKLTQYNVTVLCTVQASVVCLPHSDSSSELPPLSILMSPGLFIGRQPVYKNNRKQMQN